MPYTGGDFHFSVWLNMSWLNMPDRLQGDPMILLPGFLALSIWVWTGPVTCFSPTDYGKGDVMSLQRLRYIKFHLANRLAAFSLSSWFWRCELPCCEKSHTNSVAGNYKGSRSCGHLSNSQQHGGALSLPIARSEICQFPEWAWKMIHCPGQHSDCIIP